MNDGEDDEGRGRGLALRGEGGLTTYAGMRRRAELAMRMGWHGETMPAGMELGRAPTPTEPGRYLWRDPAGGAIELAYVPEGPFLRMLDRLSELNIQWYYGPIMEGFYAGVFPTTVGEFRRFVEATGYVTEAERVGEQWTWQRPGSDWYGFPIEMPRADRHPVVLVSWHDAQAYCAWSGLRLLTSGEWEYAARGAEARRYPWGDEESSQVLVNTDGGKLKRILNERGVWGSGNFWNQCNEDWPTTSPVGSYPRGATPDTGLHELAGGVLQWTGSTFGGTTAMLRGDSTWCLIGPTDGRNWPEYDHLQTHRSEAVGFRVARGVNSISL
jgi:formylglycine-generating enzyme required for sulfatase activity